MVRRPPLLLRGTWPPQGGVQIRPQQVSTQVGNSGGQSPCPFGHSGVSPQDCTNRVHTQSVPWSDDSIQHWQLGLP